MLLMNQAEFLEEFRYDRTLYKKIMKSMTEAEKQYFFALVESKSSVAGLKYIHTLIDRVKGE